MLLSFKYSNPITMLAVMHRRHCSTDEHNPLTALLNTAGLRFKE